MLWTRWQEYPAVLTAVEACISGPVSTLPRTEEFHALLLCIVNCVARCEGVRGVACLNLDDARAQLLHLKRVCSERRTM